MYKKILDYSTREGLLEMDFEQKNIHWIIQLDKNGEISGPPIHNVESVANEETGTSKDKVISLLVPYSDPNYISIITDPEYYFLIGKSKVLLGDDEKDSSKNKLEFVKQTLREIGHNPLLTSLLKFLGNTKETAKALKGLKEAGMKPVDWFTFSVGGTLLVKDKKIISLWREYRKRHSRANMSSRRCYITGEMKPCVDKPTKIMFLPNFTKKEGCDLSGLGGDSFCHYGMDILPIGIEEDNRLKWGLYDLCSKGTKCGDILYIHWTKDPVQNLHDLDLLEYVDPQEISNLLKSVREGKQYDVSNTNSFYLYGITLRGSRLVVVERHTLSIDELQKNIARWFERMGDTPYSISQLIKSLVRGKSESEGSKRHIWRNLYRELLMSAVLGKPIPRDVLLRAVDLELMNQIVNDRSNPIRLCLIKTAVATTNSLHYNYGKIIGKYSNLHRLAMAVSGNTGANYVNQMLRGLVGQPKSNYQLLFNRFENLRKFYSDKINQKFPGRGTGLYNEITKTDFQVPEQAGSLSEKSEFLLGFDEETKQKN